MSNRRSRQRSSANEKNNQSYHVWEDTTLETPQAEKIKTSKPSANFSSNQPETTMNISPNQPETTMNISPEQSESIDTLLSPKRSIFNRIIRFSYLYFAYFLTIILLAASVGLPALEFAANPLLHTTIFISSILIPND